MRSVRWIGRGAVSAAVLGLLLCGQVSAAGHPTKFGEAGPLGDELTQRFDVGGDAAPLGPPPGDSLEVKPAAVPDDLGPPPNFDDFGKSSPWPELKPAAPPLQDGAVIYVSPPQHPTVGVVTSNAKPRASHRTNWLLTVAGAVAGLLVLGGVVWRVVQNRRRPPAVAVPIPLGLPRGR